VSKHVATKSITTTAIRARKGGQPIVCLTSYTAPIAKLVDPASARHSPASPQHWRPATQQVPAEALRSMPVRRETVPSQR
jgi:hypothetical protein